jgi:hypothetical protein
LRRWIEAYGVPLAFYTDWKNVYVRVPNAEGQGTGAVPLTQFGRMCASLGIQIIAAGSPQAKGRVERNHGTHQDRLVKKLRRFAGNTSGECVCCACDGIGPANTLGRPTWRRPPRSARVPNIATAARTSIAGRRWRNCCTFAALAVAKDGP